MQDETKAITDAYYFTRTVYFIIFKNKVCQNGTQL